jgi:phage minor structural protein
MTLDIKDRLTGDIRRLIDFNGLNRERGVNGEKLISLNAFDTDKNAKSYPYVEEENIVIFDGEEYVIKEVGKKPIGQTYYKEVVCIHKFFCDMREQRLYTPYTQSFTFTAILNMLFDQTGYTFEVIGSFYAESFENFGDGKDKLELFNQVLERYSAEFEILGTVIRLSKRKGLSTPTFKLLYNHNIKTIDYKQNTNNLSTHIKGFGKKNEDGSYVVTGTYTSPNASLFPADTPDGLRHAPPIKDERFLDQESLDLALEEALIDVPEVSITLSFADMRKYGYPHAVPNDGDDVYLIHEPFGLDLTVRIIKIVEYFDKDLNPIDTDVTLGNPRENITDQFSSNDKKLGQILDPNGRINQSYLPDQVKRLTDVLLSVETELEFNNGILAIDKNNANNVVVLNSKGIGISKDGGATFTEAITSDGFVLTAGAIGQLEADNIRVGAQTGSDIPALDFNSNGLRASTTDPTKYAELNGNGLDIYKGAIRLFGADGRQYMINGYMNLNYAVFPYEPFTNPWDTDVTVSGRWWTTTTATSERTIGAFVFRHEGRYLRVKVNHIMGQDNTGSGGFYLRGFGSQAAIDKINTAVGFSNYLEENGYDDVVIDLGVPTYEEMTFYLKLKSGTQGMSVFLRKTRFYQED